MMYPQGGYLNNIIAQMPYSKKNTCEQLLNLLPHKWKQKVHRQNKRRNLTIITDATYRFNKIIATATIWFIVAVAIVIYKFNRTLYIILRKRK